MTVTEADAKRERRKLITTIWHRVTGKDPKQIAMLATPEEWKFYEALLDENYAPHWLTTLTENHGKELPKLGGDNE